MDASDYRKQYAQELENAAQQSGNYKEFLDKSSSTSRRLSALNNTLGADNQDQVAESIRIIQDKEEDINIRASALFAISTEISKNHDLIDMVLALLNDTTAPAALKMSALKVLQQSSVRTGLFAPKRAEYIAALRNLIDDPNADLRKQVLEILAKEHDEYAQRRLLEGLKQPSKALVPPAKAIQMLGYDIHADHYPILKKIVKNPPSVAAKKEAVRLLGTDTASKALLKRILKDKNEKLDVRAVSATALQALDPTMFEKEAKRIALDDEEDEKLRATSITALTHFADQDSLSKDKRFNQGVQQLEGKATSPALKQATKKFLSKK